MQVKNYIIDISYKVDKTLYTKVSKQENTYLENFERWKQFWDHSRVKKVGVHLKHERGKSTFQSVYGVNHTMNKQVN